MLREAEDDLSQSLELNFNSLAFEEQEVNAEGEDGLLLKI
jgi:hypothetical protein